MSETARGQLDTEQIQRIAAEYLRELAQYYKESQATPAIVPSTDAGPNGNMLEQRVHELLKALTQPGDPQERRKDIMRAMCSQKDAANPT